MPHVHFVGADVAGTLIGIGLFSLVAFIPGYVVGWAANILDFRSQTASLKCAISVPLSIAIGPILAYWIDGLAGRAAVWAALGVCCAAFVVLLRHIRKPASHLTSRLLSRTSIAIAAALIVWIVLAVGSVSDLRIDDRLYGSVTASDQAYRTAFTDAVTRTGIAHPDNPLYYVNGPAPLRYHYFWFILCSLVDQLGGAAVSARQAFIASIVWAGIALGCTISAFLRFFVPHGTANLGRRTLTGILLLAVTGLDIVPSALLFRQHVIYMDMEWWNEAITSWAGSLLWVPNHIGGLVSGLIAFLILWHASFSHVPGTAEPRWKWTAAVVAGIALAGMVGTSIYVGLVFAVFLSLWTAITFFAGWRSHTAALVLAGVITVVLIYPYLKSLAGPAAGPASGGSFLQFTVRDFKGASVFHLRTEFPEVWKTYLVRLALLPLNYFLELGFFLLVGIIQMARIYSQRRFTPDSIAAVTLVLTSLAICTFLKSGVISNNDLGWRGFLPAQFILLIWAVDLLSKPPEPSAETQKWAQKYLSPALPLLLAIGVVSTIYSLGVLRIAEIMNDPAPEYASGKRMYAARQVYRRMREILPRAAIVQQNPDMENPVYYGLYANRQTVAGDPGCGTVFGGSSHDCGQVYPIISALFSARGASVEEAEAACRSLKIDALVVTDGDPVWKAADSWVWKMQPTAATGIARGFLMTPARRAREDLTESRSK